MPTPTRPAPPAARDAAHAADRATVHAADHPGDAFRAAAASAALDYAGRAATTTAPTLAAAWSRAARLAADRARIGLDAYLRDRRPRDADARAKIGPTGTA